MKKALIRMLLFYGIPFVFLAMNEDATAGTLSFSSSCIFVWFFQTEKWGWYFKPFTPYQFVVFVTIIAFVIQLIIMACLVKKQKEGEK